MEQSILARFTGIFTVNRCGGKWQVLADGYALAHLKTGALRYF